MKRILYFATILFALLLFGAYYWKIEIIESNEYYSLIKTDNQTLDISNDFFEENESRILRNPEWEQLNKFVFFRRSTAYYYIDTSLLHVYFVTKSEINHDYDFMLIAKYENRILTAILHGTSIRIHDDKDPYELCSLSYNLDIAYEFGIQVKNTSIVENFKLEIFIIDRNSKSKKVKQTTKYPIEVKIGYFDSQNDPSYRKKTGSVVCTALFFYGDMELSEEYYFKQFQWWFELNKRIGYKKVVVHNTSIPNTPKYNELFNKHKDFVEVVDIKYFPNYFFDQDKLSDDAHVYLNNQSGKIFDITKYTLFHILVNNDCYLKNKFEYEYVTIIDLDEVIIPRNNKKIIKNSDAYNLIKDLNLKDISDKNKLNQVLNLEKSCPRQKSKDLRKGDIDNYFAYLYNVSDYSLKRPTGFHFGMGYYLSDKSVDLIIKAFEVYFDSLEFKNKAENNQEHLIELKDTFYQNFTYKFILKSKNDVAYANNLIKIYKILIRDFLMKNKEAISKYSYEYNRFFYLAGELTSQMLGKTAHHTDVSISMTCHYADDTWVPMIDYNSGLDSHFRVTYSFRDSQIPITDLVLDLNYLYCYYRDILKELANLDIILDK